MGNCKPCGSQAISGMSKYWVVRRSFERSGIVGFPIPEAVAIIWFESQGNMSWQKTSAELRTNANVAAKATGLEVWDVLQQFALPPSLGREQFAVFRFEPSWWSLVRADKRFLQATNSEKMLLSCSTGIAQKSMFYLTAGYDLSESLGMARTFMHNIDFQISQLAKDLMECGLAPGQNFDLVATRYNAGPACHVVSGYGKRAAEFADKMSKELVATGYPLCLLNRLKTPSTPSL